MIPGSLVADDGTRLRTLAYPAAESRGRVLVVHGLGEHAGRFTEMAEGLQARGYSVFLYDQRGHGASEGRRGWVSGFERFLDDVEAARREADRALPGAGPLFLYGHSMGAVVAIRFVQTRRPELSGAVLSAPWLRTAMPIPRWKEWGADLLRRVAPTLRVPTGVQAEQLTADPEMQRAYEEDPLLVHGISVALYDAVLEAQEGCLGPTGWPGLPALVLLALDDPLVDLDCIRGWARAAGPGVEVAELPGARHEPHNDLVRGEVFARVADWMDVRTREGRAG